MRIVAGKHRSRRLLAPPGRGIRPTADRTRESLFNMLATRGSGGGSAVVGAMVLDGFCGTGALGLEALSRGAAHAVFIDLGRPALEACRANVAELGEERHSLVLTGDVTGPPALPAGCAPRDLVLLDPPYRSGLAAPAIAALDASGWLAEDPLLIVELSAKDPFDPPAGFSVTDERRYGAARVLLLRRA